MAVARLVHVMENMANLEGHATLLHKPFKLAPTPTKMDDLGVPLFQKTPLVTGQLCLPRHRDVTLAPAPTS